MDLCVLEIESLLVLPLVKSCPVVRILAESSSKMNVLAVALEKGGVGALELVAMDMKAR